VRPEDLLVLADDDARPGLQALVEVVEPVGSEAFVILRCGDERLTIRVLPGQIPQVGQQVRLGCDAQRLHLFDAATEERIETTATA
jgi:multiple sugar transport system ATP-binding protein